MGVQRLGTAETGDGNGRIGDGLGAGGVGTGVGCGGLAGVRYGGGGQCGGWAQVRYGRGRNGSVAPRRGGAEQRGGRGWLSEGLETKGWGVGRNGQGPLRRGMASERYAPAQARAAGPWPSPATARAGSAPAWHRRVRDGAGGGQRDDQRWREERGRCTHGRSGAPLGATCGLVSSADSVSGALVGHDTRGVGGV